MPTDPHTRPTRPARRRRGERTQAHAPSRRVRKPKRGTAWAFADAEAEANTEADADAGAGWTDDDHCHLHPGMTVSDYVQSACTSVRCCARDVAACGDAREVAAAVTKNDRPIYLVALLTVGVVFLCLWRLLRRAVGRSHLPTFPQPLVPGSSPLGFS